MLEEGLLFFSCIFKCDLIFKITIKFDRIIIKFWFTGDQVWNDKNKKVIFLILLKFWIFLILLNIWRVLIQFWKKKKKKSISHQNLKFS